MAAVRGSAISSFSMASASSSACVIVAGEMQKSMHREMRQMMRKGLVLGARFAFRRLVGDHDIAEQARDSGAARGPCAGNDRTLVAASLQRQSRLSVRIAASSVSTMASSPSHCRHHRRRLRDRPAQQCFRVALLSPERGLRPRSRPPGRTSRWKRRSRALAAHHQCHRPLRSGGTKRSKGAHSLVSRARVALSAALS